MIRLKQVALRSIRYPIREYHKLQSYYHRRDREETISWNLGLWTRLHPSLQQGYKYCFILVAVVWLICLIFAIWVAASHKAEAGLVYTLQTGGCDAARSTNFWIHLLINILASSLYAVSSFVMQRLAAPAREDIDKAHIEGAPLKIGSLAITNLLLLGYKRQIVFGLLWASSLPIHLVFNSLVVYSSTNAEWPSYVFMLSTHYLDSFESNHSIPATSGTRQFSQLPKVDYNGAYVPTIERELQAQYIFRQQPPLVELALADCIQTFSSGSNEQWGDVILVHGAERMLNDYVPVTPLKEPLHSSSYLPTAAEDPWSWMCGDYGTGKCDAQTILKNGT